MTKRKSAIKIDCAFDQMVALDQLTPHPDNPHLHPPKQVRKLADFIKEHGWRHPIIVSNRSGYIVAGHCRWRPTWLWPGKQKTT